MTPLTSIPDTLIFLSGGVLATSLVWFLIWRHQKQLFEARFTSQQQQFEQDMALTKGLSERELEQLQGQLQQSQAQLSEQTSQIEQYQQDTRQLQQQCQQLIAAEQVLQESLKHRDSQLDELKQKREAYEALLAEHNSLRAKAEAEQEHMAKQLQLLNESKQQLGKEFEVLANRIFEEKQQAFSRQSQSTIDASVNPLKEQLKDFRKKVEDVYGKEAAERNQLVGQIAELQKQTSKIGEDALNLANAIKGDNKAQGNWGEVILERLLEESGLQKGREYDVQVSLKSEEGARRNPDVIIRLPENKDIVIDSKVSLVHYEKYYGADSEPEKSDFLKQHVNSLRTHIKQLGAKSYEDLEGLRTLDFVFLFVPVEAAFMLALQEDPGLFREAYDKHIVLVSPTTLLATLRTVENIWRYEKQNKNAEEIARQAGGLYDQFVLLIAAFEDIGKQLDKAQVAYDLTQKRLANGRGNLIGRVEKLRKLGAKTKKQLAQAADNQDAEELTGSVGVLPETVDDE
ncbi:MAG: DNA recombination protein RmuC [Candidatus Pelagadaptatus aseana]|uniref:DNA recombination protein RmuC n=1 Tax=Candidatus Pelagadaptatus aseana TaxID=3120508 RepID=UPI0039B15D13